jgi:hypothetical protein
MLIVGRISGPCPTVVGGVRLPGIPGVSRPASDFNCDTRLLGQDAGDGITVRASTVTGQIDSDRSVHNSTAVASGGGLAVIGGVTIIP